MTSSHLDKFPKLKQSLPETLSSEAKDFLSSPSVGSREIRAIVVGAGLSGIIAGVLLPLKVDNLKLTIYERNSGFGGTWFTHEYPGVRCDVPSHVYQSTFEPNLEWPEEYSQGSEIRKYWESVAKKYNVDKFTKLSQDVIEARWNGEKGVWKVKLRDLTTGKEYEDEAEVFITAIGRFVSPKIPDFPGLEDFKGEILHPASWDGSFNAKGKRLAIIGNGATGVQLLPKLQPEAAHIDHYVRHATWITPSIFGFNLKEPQGNKYTEQDLEDFKDPEKYLKFRKELELYGHGRFDGSIHGSDGSRQLVVKALDYIYDSVKGDEELFKKVVPDYVPGCRRLTPAPGYLDALTKENVDYIVSPIKKFTASGILTEDGVERPIDALISATGYQSHLVPGFPVYGSNGKLLSESLAASKSPSGHSVSYFGTALPDFPNYLYIFGIQSNPVGGSVPFHAETQVVYIAKILRKLQLENIKSIVPSHSASEEFTEKIYNYGRVATFTKGYETYFVEKDSNGELRPSIFWPGTAYHALVLKQSPRWEDFEYELWNPNDRFSYFGNGKTVYEDEGGDLAHYLTASKEKDLKSLHEAKYYSSRL